MTVFVGAVEQASELPEALEEGIYADVVNRSPIVWSGVFSSSQLDVRYIMRKARVAC